jgi:XTP/dITP diphosphohydrolase
MTGKKSLQLVFVTNNKNKFEEINHSLGGMFHLLNLTDLGFTGDIPEDFSTLEENAAQKARFIYDQYGIDCFADDTGLEIDALKGEPGVYSARYAGKNCTFEDNINKVMRKMEGILHRKATFRTVIALIEGGNMVTFEGSITGTILTEKQGMYGFGYDPIFRPDGYSLSFAEMPFEMKNRISHRGIAMQKLVAYLLEKLR